MAKTPSQVLTVNSASSATTSLVSPSFTPIANGLIVVKLATENDSQPTIGALSGGSLTYVSAGRPSITGVTGNCQVAIRTALVGASPSAMTVTLAFSGIAGWRSMTVEVWDATVTLATTPNIDAVSSNATASSTCLGTSAGNVISSVWADFAAVVPGSPTYRGLSPVSENIHDKSGTGNYVSYYNYQDVSGASAQTYGMSAPTGTTDAMAAIELLVSGGAVADPLMGRLMAPRR